MANRRLQLWQIKTASDLLDKKAKQRNICDQAHISPNTLQEIIKAKKATKLSPKKLQKHVAEYYNFHDSKHKKHETYFEKLQEDLLTQTSDLSQYKEKKYSRQHLIKDTLQRETVWKISDYVDRAVTHNMLCREKKLKTIEEQEKKAHQEHIRQELELLHAMDELEAEEKAHQEFRKKIYGK